MLTLTTKQEPHHLWCTYCNIGHPDIPLFSGQSEIEAPKTHARARKDC